MSSHVLAPSKPISVVRPDDVSTIVEAAQRAPLKRARLCLHVDATDPIQEMVIAFIRGSYIAPHRHLGKSESFHVMSGELEVVFFHDSGSVAQRLRLSADDPRLPSVYRLRSPLWHTVVLHSDHVVLHEVTNGPWRSTDTEIAPWAPQPEDTVAVNRFLSALETPTSA